MSGRFNTTRHLVLIDEHVPDIENANKSPRGEAMIYSAAMAKVARLSWIITRMPGVRMSIVASAFH